MNLNVEKEVAALKRMAINELRAKYADVFGEATNARQRAAELANDSDLRTTAPKVPRLVQVPVDRAKAATLQIAPDRRLPMPGQEITREYKGQTLIVRVLPDGFEFEGFAFFDEMQNGTIDVLEIKHGLPFRVIVTEALA